MTVIVYSARALANDGDTLRRECEADECAYLSGQIATGKARILGNPGQAVCVLDNGDRYRVQLTR